MADNGAAEKQKGVSDQSSQHPSRKGQRPPELSAEEKRVVRDVLNKFRLKARSKVATRDGPGIDSPQYGNGEESWVNEFLTEMDSASPSRTGKRPPELSAEEKRVARDVLNIFRLNAQLEVVRRDGPGKDNPRDGPGKDNPQYGHGEGSWINEFLADMEDSP